MINLKDLAGDRFRITLDAAAQQDPSRSERPWLYRIPARYGFVGVSGPDALMAHCHAARVTPRLLAIPGVVARQTGDAEVNATFPPDRLDEVADVLQARRRRRLSPEARGRATARLAMVRPIPHSGAA
jgi:hypothetical protein